MNLRYWIVLALGAALGVLAVLVINGQHTQPATSFDTQAPPAILVPVKLAGVIDDRARFREIFCALDRAHGAQFPVQRSCADALQQLGGERPVASSDVAATGASHMHIVIVPGMFGQCVENSAKPLEDAGAYMRRQGYRFDTIEVGGRASSSENAAIIAKTLPNLRKPGERLLIIGYSKGMSDILEALALDPAAIPPGSAVVSLAGIVSGTPLADHPVQLDQIVSRLPLSQCGSGDPVQSVSRQRRIAWLADHPLPPDRTYFSVAAFADSAHISTPLRQTHALLARVDARNDGQVVYTDAILPGSHLLGYVNADHWAIALPFARNVPALRPLFAGRNDFPREMLLEAIVRSVEERLRLQYRAKAKVG